MSIRVKKVDFPQQSLLTDQPEISQKTFSGNCLNLVKNLEIECQIRLGTVNITLAELQKLTTGETLVLDQNIQDPLEILVNQQVIARGELMSHDDFFAIHLTEVLT